MSYTEGFQLDFPTDTLNDNGDTIRLQLYIEDIYGAFPEPIDPASVGLEVKDYGQFELKFDLDDLFLVPGQVTVQITDKQKWLWDLLFNDYLPQPVYNKQVQVRLYVNGFIEYEGFGLEDALFWDENTQVVTITSAGHTDKLNDTAIFQDDDNQTPFDRFGYNEDLIQITKIISDIYTVVSPNLTVEFKSNWQVRSGPQDPVLEYNIFDPQVYFIAAWFFTYTDLGLQNFGDILRHFCVDWGCFTGIINYNRAFMWNFFTFDGTDLQTLDTVYDIRTSYPFGVYKYLNFTTAGYDNTQRRGDQEQAGNNERQVRKNHSPYFVTYPGGGYASLFIYDPPAGITNPDGVEDGRNPTLDMAWNPDQIAISADYWWHYKSTIDRLMVDVFLVKGVRYDFLKNFVYGGNNYQIIQMKTTWLDNTTEIHAIRLT